MVTTERTHILITFLPGTVEWWQQLARLAWCRLVRGVCICERGGKKGGRREGEGLMTGQKNPSSIHYCAEFQVYVRSLAVCITQILVLLSILLLNLFVLPLWVRMVSQIPLAGFWKIALSPPLAVCSLVPTRAANQAESFA